MGVLVLMVWFLCGKVTCDGFVIILFEDDALLAEAILDWPSAAGSYVVVYRIGSDERRRADAAAKRVQLSFREA